MEKVSRVRKDFILQTLQNELLFPVFFNKLIVQIKHESNIKGILITPQGSEIQTLNKLHSLRFFNETFFKNFICNANYVKFRIKKHRFEFLST